MPVHRLLATACRWLPALLLGWIPAGNAALVINEILPDPAGSDAGHEFVEFLNTGLELVDLSDVEFQFANGAEGPVWQTRWRGTAGLVLAPGDRFLLVDRTWADSPPGDAAATLALQNGPDAVRLVRADEVLDLVGYGALTDPLLSEGEPAVLVPGLALARRPDGADTGSNRDDFTTAQPTPGALNFRRWSAQGRDLVLEPPSLARAGEAVTVRLTLHNDGLEPWPAVDVLLTGGCGGGRRPPGRAARRRRAHRGLGVAARAARSLAPEPGGPAGGGARLGAPGPGPLPGGRRGPGAERGAGGAGRGPGRVVRTAGARRAGRGSPGLVGARRGRGLAALAGDGGAGRRPGGPGPGQHRPRRLAVQRRSPRRRFRLPGHRGPGVGAATAGLAHPQQLGAGQPQLRRSPAACRIPAAPPSTTW